jgi:hypothetical protein
MLLGVCEIFMRFQKEDSKSYWTRSGWLIKEKTVITAAHNIYRKEIRFHAVKVLVCIGYEGARCAPGTEWGTSVLNWLDIIAVITLLALKSTTLLLFASRLRRSV